MPPVISEIFDVMLPSSLHPQSESAEFVCRLMFGRWLGDEGKDALEAGEFASIFTFAGNCLGDADNGALEAALYIEDMRLRLDMFCRVTTQVSFGIESLE